MFTFCLYPFIQNPLCATGREEPERYPQVPTLQVGRGQLRGRRSVLLRRAPRSPAPPGEMEGESSHHPPAAPRSGSN